MDPHRQHRLNHGRIIPGPGACIDGVNPHVNAVHLINQPGQCIGRHQITFSMEAEPIGKILSLLKIASLGDIGDIDTVHLCKTGGLCVFVIGIVHLVIPDLPLGQCHQIDRIPGTDKIMGIRDIHSGIGCSGVILV